MMEHLSIQDSEYRAKLLVKHGFIKSDKKKGYSFDSKKSHWVASDGKNSNPEHANEEVAEILDFQYTKTGFPKPWKLYRMEWQMHDMSIEEPYFWVLDTLKSSFPNIEKLEDAFAAAENSAFFGTAQQRLGVQQDKITQFLATTGKMIKELFQMVRELRILKERIHYYRRVEEELQKPQKEREKGDDIVMKGIFIDLVQGGGKSAASIYGMAQQLEFVTLPDLFFDAPPFKNDVEIRKYVDALASDFNNNVLRVLIRHLNNYNVWRKSTHGEHEQRHRFMLAYLQQHFEIIQMYITWIKPYLRNVQKLGLKQRGMSSADLVASFEGSLVDIEFLATKETKPSIKGHDCVLVTFNYRTRAELKVQNEGYQRGPVHIGKMEFALRVYSWTKNEIDAYKRLKQEETMLLFGDVSQTVQAAMNSLGDELSVYLDEARGVQKEKEEEKKNNTRPKRTFMEAFLGDLHRPTATNSKSSPPSRADIAKQKAKEKQIKEFLEAKPLMAAVMAWNTFNNFKKAHRMIAW